MVRQSNKELKIQHLKDDYKKYTDYVIEYQKHVNHLFSNWIIDATERNSMMQQLDITIKKLTKAYNKHLLEIHQNNDPDDTKQIYIHDPINQKIYDDYKLLSPSKNFYEIDVNDPFHLIRQDLLEMTYENGCTSINKFLKFYLCPNWKMLLNTEYHDTYRVYNQIFVPLGIVIKPTKKSSSIKINKTIIFCMSLINNTCNVSMIIKGLKFIFIGYIPNDFLNARLRTSQICNNHIFQIKKDVHEYIELYHPEIDQMFLSRHLKFSNQAPYFICQSKNLVKMIVKDYQVYAKTSKLLPGDLMKYFVSLELYEMYQVINVLLLGSKEDISMASLVFSLLKDKKTSDILGNIIFFNLSFHSQSKLKKASISLKNEMAKIQNTPVEKVSIDKQLAAMIDMPQDAKKYIKEKHTEIQSGENNHKLQVAIDGLMQYPWKPKDYKNEFTEPGKTFTGSRKIINKIGDVLDKTAYGQTKAKKTLIELVGQWLANPESNSDVIGLVGPPGVGKTLFAKNVGKALGLPVKVINLGGLNDSSDLVGHNLTYANAQYGSVLRSIIKAGQWRSILVFDEVDKTSLKNDINEIENALLHITDPNSRENYQDRFYGTSVSFDLSGVLIFFTGNSFAKMNEAFKERMKIIEVSAYSIQEKIFIVQNYILQEHCDKIGFNRESINIEDNVVRYIIENYTTEAGVRILKQIMDQIIQKINTDRIYLRGPFKKIIQQKYLELTGNLIDIKSENKCDSFKSYISSDDEIEKLLSNDVLNDIFSMKDIKINVTIDDIHRYLESPKLSPEKIYIKDMVGVISGLYATDIGVGGIVPIQIYKNYIGHESNGHNIKLKITGNQKKIMRESVTCALTVAINMLSSNHKNRIVEKFPNGFHIHTPDAGTPKDGPSAGCAYATAFISVLLGKKINRKIAMTGEIDLTGKICQIGGLEAKLNGAKKAGIERVYICEENKQDYLKIKEKNPELFDNKFMVKIVSHITDIIKEPDVIMGRRISDFNNKAFNKN